MDWPFVLLCDAIRRREKGAVAVVVAAAAVVVLAKVHWKGYRC